MRLRVLTILVAAALLVPGAYGVLHHDPVGRTSYAGGVTIPEPASLALLGAALLGFAKLLRRKLRRSLTTPDAFIGKHPADEQPPRN